MLYRTMIYLVIGLLSLESSLTESTSACPETTREQAKWNILSENIKGLVTLECSLDKIYPFCDMKLIKRVIWRLPSSLVGITMEKDQQWYGIETSVDGFKLTINGTNFPPGVDPAGVYECIALAPNQEDDTQLTFYYLTWGMDVFASEPMLIDGPFAVRYGRNLGFGMLAMFVLLIFFAITKLVGQYSYTARKKRDTEANFVNSVMVTRYDNQTVTNGIFHVQ